MNRNIIISLLIFCIFIINSKADPVVNRNALLIDKHHRNFREEEYTKVPRIRCKIYESDYFISYDLAVIKVRNCEIINNFISKPVSISEVLIVKSKLEEYNVPKCKRYIAKPPKPIVFKNILVHKNGRVGIVR